MCTRDSGFDPLQKGRMEGPSQAQELQRKLSVEEANDIKGLERQMIFLHPKPLDLQFHY
jgi:aspartate carbamoyltransferase catalytic subunit